jgi:succinate-acetate transporter protein
MDQESLRAILKSNKNIGLADKSADPVPFGLIGFSIGIFVTGLNALNVY